MASRSDSTLGPDGKHKHLKTAFQIGSAHGRVSYQPEEVRIARRPVRVSWTSILPASVVWFHCRGLVSSVPAPSPSHPSPAYLPASLPRERCAT